ncbi:DUF4440 domain-containing protein [Flavobacterium longum]|uniref:nuclear transport factor 2 family protein n=1 Tax=Flavobacterium longum TaxID=1299340 RepID=UPI0039E82DF7
MKTIKLIIFLLIGTSSLAQESKTSYLYLAVKSADSLLFERGFNHCDFAALEKLAHQDLQFLHDQAGMQDRKAFFEAVRNNICGSGNKPTRQQIGEFSVYPLYDNGKLYGAIQIGDHEFFNSENGQKPRQTTVAKFVHTWLLVGGQWQLYRVLSYDHQSVEH